MSENLLLISKTWTIAQAPRPADPFSRERATAVHLTSRYGFPKKTKVLIDGGADIGAKDSHKNTALHPAVQGSPVSSVIYSEQGTASLSIPRSSEDVVDLILQAGSDVNAKNDDGQTPLHLAAKTQQKKNIEVLLDSGADPNISDSTGNYPLHYAVQGVKMSGHLTTETSGYWDMREAWAIFCNKDVTRLLVRNGADVNVKNSKNERPIELISQECNNVGVNATTLDAL